MMLAINKMNKINFLQVTFVTKQGLPVLDICFEQANSKTINQ